MELNIIQKIEAGEPITDNDLFYARKTRQIETRYKAVDQRLIKNDAGGYYTETTYHIKVITPNKTYYFEDVIYDAPWQIGGNSGQIRTLKPITEEDF